MGENKGKNEFLQILGQNIKKYRTQKGLSQAELAKRCGFDKDNSRSTISKIEKGVNDAPASTLKAIARELGVSVCDLTQNTEEIQKKMLLHNLLEEVYGSKAEPLLELFQNLNASGQDEVMKYVTYIDSQAQYNSVKKESSNAKAIS